MAWCRKQTFVHMKETTHYDGVFIRVLPTNCIIISIEFIINPFICVWVSYIIAMDLAKTQKKEIEMVLK